MAEPQIKNQIIYVSFIAEIIPASSEALLRTCADLANKGVDTVYLMVSTPGGSVAHGMTLYNTLRGMPFKLITHNTGSVNSIGNVLFLAGEKRYACPHATFMFHGVGFDVKGGTRLEEKFLRERLDSIGADQQRIAAVIRERANFPNAKDIGDLFLEAVTKDAAYAKQHGIVDDVRDVEIPKGATILQLVFQR